MEIKATGTMNLEALCALSRVMMFRKANPRNRMLLWGGVFLLLAAYVGAEIYFSGPEDSLVLSMLILLAVVGMGIYLYFFLPRKQYKNLGKLRNAVNIYTFTEENLHVDTEAKGFSATSDNAYSGTSKVMETDQYFFIWPAKDRVFIVEKATITGGTVEDVRKLVTSHDGAQYIRCRY